MELEEAIEHLKDFTTDKLERDKLEINPRGGFKIGAIYKYAVLDTAIDTVLKELDNRIHRKDIEDKIKELKEKLENVRNKEDRIRNGVAIIVLEYCIDSMNELLNKE